MLQPVPAPPATLSRPPAQPPSRQTALVALAAVQLLFGVWPVLGARVLQHLSPQALVGARIWGATPLLLLLIRPWRTLSRPREVLQCMGLGLLGVAGNQSLFVLGLAHSTPNNSAVMGCLIPAWTLLFALLLRRETATALRMTGIAVALGGALLLVGLDRVELGGDHLTGNLLLMGNTSLYSAYLVLSRPLVARHGALPVVAWVFAGSALLVLPWSGPALAATPWSQLPSAVWWSLAAIVIGPSLLSYLLNAWALQALPASTVAVFVYVQPLITALASWWGLGQLPAWQLLPSAALICGGVALVSRQPPSVRKD